MIAALHLGLLIGMRHALEADHVAAVASLVVHSKSIGHSVRQGAVWGAGHTISLFVVGLFVLVTESVMPHTMAHYLEICVGLMLVFLGADVVWRTLHARVHFHVHDHAHGVRHFHAHSHRGEPTLSHDARHHEHVHSPGFPTRALVVGLMHGMAGSAALILLALDQTVSLWQGIAYIAFFGVGSIVGMALLSVAIAWPLRSGRHLTWFHRTLQGTVGACSMLLGMVLIHHSLAALA